MKQRKPGLTGPQIGRFINADDPAVGEINLYSYCDNDPVSGYDPDGYYNRTKAINYAQKLV